MMETVNLHLYMTNFTMSKSRIIKETGSIASSGMVDRVYVVALWAQNQLRVEKLGKKRLVLRIQLKTRNMPKILVSLNEKGFPLGNPCHHFVSST